jgi:dTDP-4-dehydrorhamnose 3,5-epimerase
MNLIPTPLSGAFVLEQTALRDERGYFARVFCEREFGEKGLCTHFLQTNHSLSLRRGTIRGLHYQVPPSAEVKVLRCIRGAVQDVMVDLRQGSPSFLRWHSEVLSEDNLKMVYVPAGFAHGFQALEDGTAVTYQSSSYYSSTHERGVRYNDPLLRIEWQLPQVIVSPKDQGWPNLDPSFSGVALRSASTRRRRQPKPVLPKRSNAQEERDAEVEDVTRLEELEAENARLKQLLAELLPDPRALQERANRSGLRLDTLGAVKA